MSSLNQWQLKPHVHVLTTTPEHVIISWLGQRILLKTSAAPDIPKVFKLLNAPQTLETLEASLDGKWSRESISNLLKSLANQKLIFSHDTNSVGLRDKTEKFEDSDSPWWPYFNLLASSIDEWRSGIAKVDALKVKIITRMKIPEDFLSVFQPTLNSPDQPNLFTEHEGQLLVLILSSADSETLEALSSKALKTGASVLPVLLDLSGAIAGPVMGVPGQPCLRCLSKRLLASTEKIELLLPLSIEHIDDVKQAWPFTYWQKLNAILLDEIFKLKSELTYSALHRGAYLFDFFNQRSDYDEVFPIPGCDCSTGSMNGI
jgi:hypothetical protein